MKLHLSSAALLILTACATNGPDGASTSMLQAECEAMISAETQTRLDGVTAVSTVPDASGTTVTVSVAGSDVPWVCRADSAGVIEGIGVQE